MLRKTLTVAALLVAVAGPGIPVKKASRAWAQEEAPAKKGLNKLVQQLMDARLNYGENLQRLIEYYQATGDSRKQRQAKRELDEFREIRQRKYLPGLKARLIVVELDTWGPSDIIESLVGYRLAYRKSLETLIKVLKGAKDVKHWTRAKRELKGLIAVNKYLYLRDADTPGPHLRPSEQISEADELYEQAMRLKKKSKPLGVRRYETQLAMETFGQLIRDYPSSDKIDEAAYQIGELCRDNLKDYQRALRWYECVVAWDRATQLPANLRIAQIYDRRLVNRMTALDYYRRALKIVPRDSSEHRSIAKRINQLRGK